MTPTASSPRLYSWSPPHDSIASLYISCVNTAMEWEEPIIWGIACAVEHPPTRIASSGIAPSAHSSSHGEPTVSYSNLGSHGSSSRGCFLTMTDSAYGSNASNISESTARRPGNESIGCVRRMIRFPRYPDTSHVPKAFPAISIESFPNGIFLIGQSEPICLSAISGRNSHVSTNPFIDIASPRYEPIPSSYRCSSALPQFAAMRYIPVSYGYEQNTASYPFPSDCPPVWSRSEADATASYGGSRLIASDSPRMLHNPFDA